MLGLVPATPGPARLTHPAKKLAVPSDDFALLANNEIYETVELGPGRIFNACAVVAKVFVRTLHKPSYLFCRADQRNG